VLQCVAVCCSVCNILQCAAMFCSALERVQCAAVCCSVLLNISHNCSESVDMSAHVQKYMCACEREGVGGEGEKKRESGGENVHMQKND